MNQFSAWGGGSGWAGSPEQALQRFNGGTITPGMVEGYYRQQWAGQLYNIEAGYASKGNGFYISATSTSANDANIAVAYTSYEKMAQLMGMNGNNKLEWNWGLDMALGALENNVGNIIKDRYVISWPGYGPHPIQGPITIKYPLGTFDISRARLGQIANGLKVGGVVLGVIGMYGTYTEIRDGKKNLIGEGGLDLIMGGVGFIPGGGWIVSGAYFGGKAVLTWVGWDFWN